MSLEKAYLDAIAGANPASLGFDDFSDCSFQGTLEYLVLLFSSRANWQARHIPARYSLNADLVLRYSYNPGIAEAQLEFFSWKWRYAVMYCVATAIRGLPQSDRATCVESSPYFDTVPFRGLLLHFAPIERLEIIDASRSWPEALQLRLWLAIRLMEGKAWDSLK